MSTIEVQDYIHVYSMFSFRDGRKEPGIIVNKYNVVESRIEYFFISHSNMGAYRQAFDAYDRDTCKQLSVSVELNDILNIRPVSLADYKATMQLLDERLRQLNANR